jgi:hypothetical protein
MTTATTATTATTLAHVVAAARRVYADHGARVTLGAVTLAVEGGRFAMRGPQGTHSIAAESSITSLARLVAHLSGFVGVEMLDVEQALRRYPAGEAPTSASTRRAVSRRGPGGVTYTPAKGEEPALITLPFGKGQASLDAATYGDLDLTPAQLRWLDRVVDEAMGADDADD